MLDGSEFQSSAVRGKKEYLKQSVCVEMGMKLLELVGV